MIHQPRQTLSFKRFSLAILVKHDNGVILFYLRTFFFKGAKELLTFRKQLCYYHFKNYSNVEKKISTWHR